MHCGNNVQERDTFIGVGEIFEDRGRGGTFSLSSLFSNGEGGRERRDYTREKDPPRRPVIPGGSLHEFDGPAFGARG